MHACNMHVYTQCSCQIWPILQSTLILYRDLDTIVSGGM